MCDMHWKWTALQAIKLIDAMDRHDLWFAEAPCQPEDIDGQAQVAASVRTSVALGEEWRTAYEYRPRFVKRCMDIVQPEMGHTGVTEFMKIARMAEAFHCKVIPHASIGIGIFQAASLHAAAALPNVPYHEYQHSIFDKNLRYVSGDMRCVAGFFHLPRASVTASNRPPMSGTCRQALKREPFGRNTMKLRRRQMLAATAATLAARRSRVRRP